jgi:phospholipid-translocating ATPase
MECKIKAAMRAYNPPSTKKEVRAFLGLCGYYRRFIPAFSSIATPLSDLTRKNKGNKVVWSPECESAFVSLKEALVNYPVLTTPDWASVFILQTDASNTGLGYVLSQKDSNGDEHPIAYGSWKLLPREQRYSTIEREALAIVSGIKHYRVYLEGTKFQIETDHDPLSHLANLKDSHGRLARWALSLQDFDFKISHRAGSKNANADGLSRDRSRTEEEGVSENGTPTSLTEHSHASCVTMALNAADGVHTMDQSDTTETNHSTTTTPECMEKQATNYLGQRVLCSSEPPPATDYKRTELCIDNENTNTLK